MNCVKLRENVIGKIKETLNKQTNKQNSYSHILNLNTVILQISKETLFEAGKSNRIKNNEN